MQKKNEKHAKSSGVTSSNVADDWMMFWNVEFYKRKWKIFFPSFTSDEVPGDAKSFIYVYFSEFVYIFRYNMCAVVLTFHTP